MKKREEIYGVILSFTRKMKYDYVSSFAGNAALFILMSLFPMLMYCVSMIRYIPILDDFLITDYFEGLIPSSVIPFLDMLLEEAYKGGTTTLKWFSIIVTLVCASKGVYAIIIGLNAIYGIRETRNIVILYALAVVYVLAFFCILSLIIVLIVFGNKIFMTLMGFMPFLKDFKGLFHVGKYLGMLILLQLFFLGLYITIPNRKSKIRYEFSGAFFSSVAVLLFSSIFTFYFDHYANYSITYGSLATIVVFMIWLYGTMYIVFIGAELNGVLRKAAEYNYNYRRTYEYYKDEYQGDLLREKDFQILRNPIKHKGEKK